MPDFVTPVRIVSPSDELEDGESSIAVAFRVTGDAFRTVAVALCGGDVTLVARGDLPTPDEAERRRRAIKKRGGGVRVRLTKTFYASDLPSFVVEHLGGCDHWTSGHTEVYAVGAEAHTYAPAELAASSADDRALAMVYEAIDCWFTSHGVAPGEFALVERD